MANVVNNSPRGKGAFKPSEVAHSKRLSRSEFRMGKGGIGGSSTAGTKLCGKGVKTAEHASKRAGHVVSEARMNYEHGQHGKSKNNNMSHNTGGYRIGSGTRTFKAESYRLAGPKSFGAKSQHAHKGQADGHFGDGGYKKIGP